MTEYWDDWCHWQDQEAEAGSSWGSDRWQRWVQSLVIKHQSNLWFPIIILFCWSYPVNKIQQYNIWDNFCWTLLHYCIMLNHILIYKYKKMCTNIYIYSMSIVYNMCIITCALFMCIMCIIMCIICEYYTYGHTCVMFVCVCVCACVCEYYTYGHTCVCL